IGLINGSFYAMLSLGLSVIFGLLNIINFAHGAQYMMGAFAAYCLLQWVGLGYWWALVIAPLVVGLIGVVLERTMLKRLYALDHLYGLLLTFGLALVIQGLFRNQFGSSGLPYQIPPALTGGRNLGFMVLPNYRAWVVVFSLATCLVTWYVIERTKLGSYLRAATENPALVQAFGANAPRMITLTYGFGVGWLRSPACSLRLSTRSTHSWAPISSSWSSPWWSSAAWAPSRAPSSPASPSESWRG